MLLVLVRPSTNDQLPFQCWGIRCTTLNEEISHLLNVLHPGKRHNVLERINVARAKMNIWIGTTLEDAMLLACCECT